MSFVHIQAHSFYSLLRSPLSPERLVNRAHELGYQQLALTDYETMTGVIEFYEACLSKGIKPIIGLTIQVKSSIRETSDELVVLAKNNKGYQNLLALATEVSLKEGRGLSLDEIQPFKKHLISILKLPEELKEKNKESFTSALYDTWICSYKKTFTDFYLGIEAEYLPVYLRSWLDEKGVSLVAMPNVRHTNRQEQYTKNLLEIIRQGDRLGKVTMGDLNPLETDQKEQMLSPEEQIARYEKFGLKDAALHTEVIAQSIQLEISLGEPVLPKFPDVGQQSSSEYLQQLCKQQLKERVLHVTESYKKRLAYELKVIDEMGFSDYFLIVWDIIRYAHEQNIFTGSGRGSSAGSLVAYVLRITDVDPLVYDLLFERFLNKERYTMPDIDLDFPSDRRQEILDYLGEKYDTKHVAQICTLGTYRARSSLRELGRVFGLEKKEIDRWSKSVPQLGPNTTLEEALEQSTALQRLVSRNEYNRKFFEIAKTLQGIPQNYSTHAAGVVLSERSLIEIVPLMKSNMPLLLTQYTMGDVEKVGLLKLDILGLQNLTILADCLKFSRYEKSPGIHSVTEIPMNDPKTLKLFQQAETNGIFQFESDGIKRVLKKLHPTDFEDIVAVNALYRPGPMLQIDSFIERKHGKQVVDYPHKDLKSILEVTYGIMVYQEQIMRVATKLAGYSLNESDVLRRMVSKKDVQAMKEGHQQFVQRAMNRGYEKNVADQVYYLIERFADYGFNRSHAVAYSKVAYQLAYFKVHYPVSFYSAQLRSTNSKTKITLLLNEARLAKVVIQPPHINLSWFDYTVQKNTIRFGLHQIKGLQRRFVQAIIEERQSGGAFKDIIDFIKRMPVRWRESKQIKLLLYAGAFDQLGDYNRGEMLKSLDGVIESVTMSHGSMELLEVFSPNIVRAKDLTKEEKSDQEYEVLGYYFSNSLDAKQWEMLQEIHLTPAEAFKQGNQVKVLVMVQSLKTIQTKNGLPMSFIKTRDETDQITLVLFPQKHREYIKTLIPQQYYIVEGTAEIEGNEKKILIQKIETLPEVLTQIKLKKLEQYSLCVQFKDMETQKEILKEVLELFSEYPGHISTSIYDVNTQQIHQLLPEYAITYNKKMFSQLIELVGKEHVTWIEKHTGKQ